MIECISTNPFSPHAHFAYMTDYYIPTVTFALRELRILMIRGLHGPAIVSDMLFVYNHMSNSFQITKQLTHLENGDKLLILNEPNLSKQSRPHIVHVHGHKLNKLSAEHSKCFYFHSYEQRNCFSDFV